MNAREPAAGRPPAKPASSLFATRAAWALALVAACWPVLRWYVARMGDGSDDPWGLAALAAAAVFAPRQGWSEPLPRANQRILVALLAAYGASFRLLPPLAHALLFVTMAAAAVPRLPRAFAWWFLLALSLPVIASLQFYLGYPLRWATTFLCAPLLRLGGLPVAAEATTLLWRGECVVVDAPCSGVHMLWTGLFLASAQACRLNLDTRSAARLLWRSALVIVGANLLRAAALFCIQTGIWPAPAWAHEATGLLLFGAAALAIVALGRSGRRSHPFTTP